jgi:hypothetical protein
MLNETTKKYSVAEMEVTLISQFFLGFFFPNTKMQQWDKLRK